jgi:hypothetical protein
LVNFDSKFIRKEAARIGLPNPTTSQQFKMMLVIAGYPPAISETRRPPFSEEK